MKRLLLIFSLLIPVAVTAQVPRFLTADMTNQSGTSGSKDYSTGYDFESLSFGSYRFVASADASGDRYFRFRNTSGTDRRPASNGDVISLNQNSAYTSIFDGNFNAFRITGTNTGYRYIFKTNAGVTQVAVIEIQGTNLRSISTVSQSPVAGSVFHGQTVTVSVTLSGAFDAGQAAWLRYTTDGYATSTVVKLTGSGTSYSAEIPASVNQAGTTVSYYLLTSGDYGSMTGSLADLLTINGNNNGGSNYSYTVQAWTTAQAGNWSAAATWTANAVPPTASNMGNVSVNHTVLLDQNALIAGATIAGGQTLTVDNGITLITTNGISNSGSFQVNGTLQINAGGYTNNAPAYGSSSTLIYNTGGSYNRNIEWSSADGPGYPANVIIQGSTNLSMGSGSGSLAASGTVTVASGSTFSLGTRTGAITIAGDFSCSGTTTLSSNSGGDLILQGNGSFPSGSTFTANNRALVFTGSADQTLTMSGTGSVAYLLVNKPSGDLVLGSGITVNGSTGNILQIQNDGGIDLNGQTLTVSGTGTGILVAGTNGATARRIEGASGTLLLQTGTQTISSSDSRTLSIGSNIMMSLTAGCDFGASLTTINGTLRLNPGGFVSTNAPVYAAGSVLSYNTGGVYGRALEWSSTSGAGYPHHVSVSGNTTVNLSNGGSAIRQLAGNLSVESGSTLSLNGMTHSVTVLGTTSVDGTLSMGNASALLTLTGNAQINGTLSLGTSSGGDVSVSGNLAFSSSSTFTGNNRAIFFAGNGTQVLSRPSGSLTVPYLVIGSGSNVSMVQLSGVNLTVSAPLGGNAISFNSASDRFDINGRSLTVSNGAISGPGQFRGSASSSLSIQGTGNAGTFTFESGYRSLANLTMDRTSSGRATLANDMTVTGSLGLTNGDLIINGTTLTLTGSVERSSGAIWSEAATPGSLTLYGSGTGGTVAFSAGNQTLTALTMNQSGRELNLAGSVTITSSLAVQAGTLDLNGNHIVTLGSSATVSESEGNSVINSNPSGTGYITITIAPGTAMSGLNPGSLGLELTSGTDPGNVTIRRYHTARSIFGLESVKRYFAVAPDNNSGTAVTFRYNELNDLNYSYESNLRLYESTDATTWTLRPTSSVSTAQNLVSESGLGGFAAYYTVAEELYATVADGNWTSTSTWSGGSVPPDGSTVSIGHQVTLDTSPAMATVLIAAAGELDLSTESLLIQDGGRLINNGTFTASGGTVTFDSNGRIDGSAAPVFYDLKAENGTVSTFGNWTVTNSFAAGTGTISMRNAGSITTAATFNNLILESGTRTLTADIGIGGTLQVVSGDLRTSGARNLTMSGANTAIQVESGGTISGTDVGVGNDLTLVISGSLCTVGGSRSETGATTGRLFFNTTVNNGSTLALSRPFLVKYGTFAVNGTLQLNANGLVETGVVSSLPPAYGSGGSLVYATGTSVTATASEWPGTSQPSSVTVNNNTSLTLPASFSRTLTGHLNLTSGSLSDGGNTLTVQGNLTGSGTHTGAGSITLSGGSSAHQISGVTSENLILSDVQGAALTGNLVVTGTLTLTTGTLSVGNRTLEIRNPIAGTPANLSTTSLSGLVVAGSAGSISIPSAVSNLNTLTVTNSSAGVSLNGPLSLAGTLTIGAGASLLNTGNNLTAAGNLVNNGAFTGSGRVIITGAPGSVTASGTGTWSNLELNQAAGLSLASPLQVIDELRLTAGIITTGAHLVSLGSAPAAPGNLIRTNGHVNGTFRRWFDAVTTTQSLLPVGTYQDYQPLSVSFTTAPTTGGTLTARVMTADAGGSGLPLLDGTYPVNTASQDRYWVCTSGDGLTGGVFDLDILATNLPGVESPGYQNLRLLSRLNSGSPWTLQGTHAGATGTASAPVISRTGLTAFGEFTGDQQSTTY